MNKGVIKKIVDGKGFGFITVEGKSKDLFFHATGVVGGSEAFKRLQEGDKVIFADIVDNGKGDGAVGVEADLGELE